MNFERFYAYAKNIETNCDILAPTVMDVMEPLPLGVKWITLVSIRNGYGIGFMSQFYDDVLKMFKIILSVLDTDKYVGLDGNMYDEVPDGFVREHNFVYDETSSIHFREILDNYMSGRDVVDHVVDKITDLQNIIGESDTEEEISVPTHKEVVEMLDSQESTLEAVKEEKVKEEKVKEEKVKEEKVKEEKVKEEKVKEEKVKEEKVKEEKIEEEKICKNPFLNDKFLSDAKKQKSTYSLSKEIANELENTEIFVHVDSENVVTTYKLKALQKHLDKKSFPGKYYPDYRVWFDKSHKKYILWIFELENEYNYIQNIVDLMVNRPPWKWVDVDNVEYVDDARDPQNWKYAITGDRTIEVFKYLQENDVSVQFEKMDKKSTCEIKFKGKAFEKVFATPAGKYVNIDTFEYVKRAKYMDENYWWCTDNEKTWKHRDAIRNMLLMKFLDK
jgi:hypothetical protein